MASIKELLDQQLAINAQIAVKAKPKPKEQEVKWPIFTPDKKSVEPEKPVKLVKKKRGRPAKNGTTKATSTGQS